MTQSSTTIIERCSSATTEPAQLDPSVLDAVDRFVPRERVLIAMRFNYGLTQAEIASRLGISQMQVSRMLTRTLASLGRRLADRA